MSASWRREKGVSYASGHPEILPQADDSLVYEGYQAYDFSLSVINLMRPVGTNDDSVHSNLVYDGPREIYHPMAAGFYPADPQSLAGQGDISDKIDWEIGGNPGVVGDNAYSLGVVDSTTVEDFGMRGEQAIIRRQRNPSDTGDVGTSDSNALLSLLYAQSVNGYYPNEASQADLVRTV